MAACIHSKAVFPAMQTFINKKRPKQQWRDSVSTFLSLMVVHLSWILRDLCKGTSLIVLFFPPQGIYS